LSDEGQSDKGHVLNCEYGPLSFTIQCMTRPCLSIAFNKELGCCNVSELFVWQSITTAQNDDTHTAVLIRRTVCRTIELFRFQRRGLTCFSHLTLLQTWWDCFVNILFALCERFVLFVAGQNNPNHSGHFIGHGDRCDIRFLRRFNLLRPARPSRWLIYLPLKCRASTMN
jgi:hypothetical protein